MNLVIATNNMNKVKEFEALLNPLNIDVLSLKDFPEIGEIPETGKTFEENAFIKAHALIDTANLPILADDSGLTVDYLNGEPGIYSARYAGEAHNDLANNKKLLKQLENVPFEKRTAQFRCVIAMVFPDGSEYSVEGVLEGYITDAMQGENGFGYDPLFYLPTESKTLAELSMEEKNRLSHRSQAIDKALEILKDKLND